MTKYVVNKPCFYGERLYPAGATVDFGEDQPPKGSTEVPNIVEKAKAAVATKAADAEKEDAVLKGTAK
jgi:hypothetical protein